MAVGFELAALAAGASGIVHCSACGCLVSVKRSRTNDPRRAFCAKCRDSERSRLGGVDFRRRQREARAYRAQGKSMKEIAALLGIDADRVKSYLEKE